MKVKNISSGLGFTLFMLGLGGLAGACEGQGSFIVSAIVFSIGLGLSLWGIQK